MSSVCMEQPDTVDDMNVLAEIFAGILLVRRDGTVGLANRAMAAMLETSVDDLVGAKMAALFESYDAYRSFDQRRWSEDLGPKHGPYLHASHRSVGA